MKKLIQIHNFSYYFLRQVNTRIQSNISIYLDDKQKLSKLDKFLDFDLIGSEFENLQLITIKQGNSVDPIFKSKDQSITDQKDQIYSIEINLQNDVNNIFELKIFIKLFQLDEIQKNDLIILFDCDNFILNFQRKQLIKIKIQNDQYFIKNENNKDIFDQVQSKFFSINDIDYKINLNRDIQINKNQYEKDLLIQNFCKKFTQQLNQSLKDQFYPNFDQSDLLLLFNKLCKQTRQSITQQIENINDFDIIDYLREKTIQIDKINFTQELYEIFFVPIFSQIKYFIQKYINIFCQQINENIKEQCKTIIDINYSQIIQEKSEKFIKKIKKQIIKETNSLVSSQIEFFYSTETIFDMSDLDKNIKLIQDINLRTQEEILMFYNSCKIKQGCQTYIKSIMKQFKVIIPRKIGSFFYLQFNQKYQKYLSDFLKNQNGYECLKDFDKPDQASSKSSINQTIEKTQNEQNLKQFINQKFWKEIQRYQTINMIPDATFRKFIRLGVQPDRRPILWECLSNYNKIKKKTGKNLYMKIQEGSQNLIDYDEQIFSDLIRTPVELEMGLYQNSILKDIIIKQYQIDLNNISNKHKKWHYLRQQFYSQNPIVLYFKQSILNVLKSFVFFNKNVGYSQGLNFICHVIFMTFQNQQETLYQIEQKTFWLLYVIIEEKKWFEYIKLENNKIDKLVKSFKSTLKTQSNEIHNHINKFIECDWNLLFLDTFLLLFTSKLPLEQAQYVLDQFLYEGENALIQIMILILQITKEKILSIKEGQQLKNFLKDSVYNQFDFGKLKDEFAKRNN